MKALRSLLPWFAIVSCACGILGMQLIGGGGRPMFPLLVCYVPVMLAGVLVLPLLVGDGTRHLPGLLPVLSLLLLGAYLLARTCFGGDPGWRNFELLRLGGVLLVYLLFAGPICASGPRLLFVTILMGAAFCQSVMALYQAYVDPSWQLMSPLFPALKLYNPDVVGTYANKNHFSWLLGDAVLFALSLGCWGRLRWMTKGMAFYAAGICALGVFLTLSRGGVVALGAGLSLFALMSLYLLFTISNQSLLLTGSVTALALLLVGGGAAHLLSGNIVVSDRLHALWMDSFREDLWRAAMHDVGISPLFGLGAGSFQWSARLMMPFESLLAHNDVIQHLSEYGLIGMILLAGFLGVHFWRGGHAVAWFQRALDHSERFQSDSGALLLASLSVCVAQVIHSLLDFNMHLGSNALLAGACFGILANPGLHGTASKPVSPGERYRLIRFLLLTQAGALCLVMLFVLIRSWEPERRFFQAEQIGLSAPGSYDKATLDRAVIAALAAANLQPSNPRYSTMLGNLLWLKSLGRGAQDNPPASLDAAARFLARASRENPHNWFVWMRLSGVLGMSGYPEQSEEAFLEAIRRLPLFALPYVEYAGTLRTFDRLEEAAHYYRLSIGLEGAEPVTRQLRELENLSGLSKVR